MFAAIALRDKALVWSLAKKVWTVWVKGFVSWSVVFPDQNDKNQSRDFSDYLDSYFNSFDYYPACTRQIFQRNDAFALWQDFLLVAGDLAITADRMQEHPEAYVNPEGWKTEDVKARKEAIARQIKSRITPKKSSD